MPLPRHRDLAFERAYDDRAEFSRARMPWWPLCWRLAFETATSRALDLNSGIVSAPQLQNVDLILVKVSWTPGDS